MLRLSETPPRWARPTVPLGHHQPVWPPREPDLKWLDGLPKFGSIGSIGELITIGLAMLALAVTSGLSEPLLFGVAAEHLSFAWSWWLVAAISWLGVAMGMQAKSVETASNLPLLLVMLPMLGSGLLTADGALGTSEVLRRSLATLGRKR